MPCHGADGLGMALAPGDTLVEAADVAARAAPAHETDRVGGFDECPYLSSRPSGPRNLMKIALRYDRRGRERQGRALTGAVKAVYLSDPERAC